MLHILNTGLFKPKPGFRSCFNQYPITSNLCYSSPTTMSRPSETVFFLFQLTSTSSKSTHCLTRLLGLFGNLEVKIDAESNKKIPCGIWEEIQNL